MTDRYTKAVLTLIATALVYLCFVLTPLPTVEAQFTQRPGEPTGPVQVVVVGWRAPEAVPVATNRPVPVTIAEPIRISGKVTTERGDDKAERVIVAGWEENAIRDYPVGAMRTITTKTPGLPVNVR